MSWLSSLVGDIPVVGGIVNDIGKVVDPIANAAISNLIPGGSALLGAAQAIGKAIPGGSQVNAASNALGSLLGGNNGANALGIAQGINAANLQNKANTYATNALGDQNLLWNQTAPWRAQAISALPTALAANPFSRGTTPNLSPTATGGGAMPIPPGVTG